MQFLTGGVMIWIWLVECFFKNHHTVFASDQLGAESGIDNPNLRAMKTVFRIMPLVILPLTINFPTVSLSLISAFF